jgi:hypothetical protein
MKSVLLSSLSLLILSVTIAPAVEAQSKPTSSFNLVTLARKGFFKENNIPSHSALCAAVTSKRIQAKDVVKAAIAHNRLSPEMLNDKIYLKRIDVKLNQMCRRG